VEGHGRNNSQLDLSVAFQDIVQFYKFVTWYLLLQFLATRNGETVLDI